VVWFRNSLNGRAARMQGISEPPREPGNQPDRADIRFGAAA